MVITRSDQIVKEKLKRVIQTEQDRKFLRDSNIIGYVNQMRENEIIIERFEVSQFGILPERFELDEIRFSYSDKKKLDVMRSQEECMQRILDNDEDILMTES